MANSLNRSIKVLLSIQSDFYLRAYIEVSKGKKECWKSITQNGLMFYCINCCYSYAHRFGHEKKKGLVKVSKFKLPSSLCPFC